MSKVRQVMVEAIILQAEKMLCDMRPMSEDAFAYDANARDMIEQAAESLRAAVGYLYLASEQAAR